jgi:hypothetical protein
MIKYDKTEGSYCTVHGGDNIVQVDAWQMKAGSHIAAVCLPCVAGETHGRTTWDNAYDVMEATTRDEEEGAINDQHQD